MNGCKKYEDLLARYLHGEVLLQEREELEKHLSMCPDCERTYGGVSDVDRLLRDLPGKRVDPPPYLHARILASLPEEPGIFAWRTWGRRGVALGAAAACALVVAVALHLRGVPGDLRVATVPPPADAPAPRAAQPPVPAPAVEKKAPALRTAPGPARKGGGGTAVASAPKVKVIQQVKIFFYYPPARKVAVTGDFNDWNADGVPMRAAGKPGMWTTELSLPAGVYSYNFIVDGETLLPDPDAPNQMPDGYGGTNSILLVKGEGAI